MKESYCFKCCIRFKNRNEYSNHIQTKHLKSLIINTDNGNTVAFSRVGPKKFVCPTCYLVCENIDDIFSHLFCEDLSEMNYESLSNDTTIQDTLMSKTNSIKPENESVISTSNYNFLLTSHYDSNFKNTAATFKNNNHIQPENNEPNLILKQSSDNIEFHQNSQHLYFSRKYQITDETELKLRKVLSIYYDDEVLALIIDRLLIKLPDNFEVKCRFSDLKMKIPIKYRSKFDAAFENLVAEGLILIKRTPGHKAKVYFKRGFDLMK